MDSCCELFSLFFLLLPCRSSPVSPLRDRLCRFSYSIKGKSFCGQANLFSPSAQRRCLPLRHNIGIIFMPRIQECKVLFYPAECVFTSFAAGNMSALKACDGSDRLRINGFIEIQLRCVRLMVKSLVYEDMFPLLKNILYNYWYLIS